MECRSAAVMYWAVHTTLCSALQLNAKQLPYQAVMQPVKMLSNGAAVELFEDLRAHGKSFHFLRSLVMWTPRTLKLSTRSTIALSM